MAKTAVADVIIPSVFEKYAIERTAEKSLFGVSGVVEHDPYWDGLAGGGGQTVDMPFWQDLSATRQLLSDAASLNVNKIGASKDIARIQNDAQAWSVNDLAKLLSGDDPMGAIADLVADYWARIDAGLIISSLKGLFASATMEGNLLGIHSEAIANQSDATKLNGSTFVDATAKLGDKSEWLTAVAMHSATEAALRKADLIEFIPASDGKSQVRTFQGRAVIVDDACPVRDGTTDGKVYTTYLFGRGVLAKGNASLNDPVEGGVGTRGVELSRTALASDSVLINRRRYLLHPRGVKFNSASVAGDSPTNAELETAANWTRVWEAKNVRLVAVTHNN